MFIRVSRTIHFTRWLKRCLYLNGLKILGFPEILVSFGKIMLISDLFLEQLSIL